MHIILVNHRFKKFKNKKQPHIVHILNNTISRIYYNLWTRQKRFIFNKNCVGI
jgi:hypothetical protein